jgi:hypothetical protein
MDKYDLARSGYSHPLLEYHQGYLLYLIHGITGHRISRLIVIDSGTTFGFDAQLFDK